MEEGILSGKNPMRKSTDKKKKRKKSTIQKRKKNAELQVRVTGTVLDKSVLERPFGTRPWMPSWGEHKSILLQSSILEILIWLWDARLNGAGRFRGWEIKENHGMCRCGRMVVGWKREVGVGTMEEEAYSLSMSLLAFIVGAFCCFVKYCQIHGFRGTESFWQFPGGNGEMVKLLILNLQHVTPA